MSIDGIPKDTTIVVKRGDTISELAVKYNTTVESIQELNGIGTSLAAGETLRIKKNDAPDGVQRQRAYNRARQADENLLKANGMLDEYGFIADDKRADAAKMFVEKDLKSGKLVFVPESKGFLGLFKKPAHYEYYTEHKGYETWRDLKRRYNIEDGVLRENNFIDHCGGDIDKLPISKVVNIPLESLALK